MDEDSKGQRKMEDSGISLSRDHASWTQEETTAKLQLT